jgi:signal transduction histidine kinase
LGPKRSGQPFFDTDLDLLGTLTAQSTIAIQNALSYRELQTLNVELEVRVRARTEALETSNEALERTLRDLKAAQAQLLQTEKLASLGQLVAGVAHEINNPVSFIVGNVQPLRKELGRLQTLAAERDDPDLGGIAERASFILDMLARGAERTVGIVTDLRIFSRVGDVLPRPTDLHEGIEVSLRLLKPKWGDRIEIHRDYGQLPPVLAAPGQLNQVFMNILANACDAVPETGNIWIQTACEAGQVTVVIRDDGAGIAPEHLGRIFEPFFTTKPQGKGTGLGLAISYGIVTHHGGTIAARSEPGEGTEFTIVLPLQPPTMDAA